MGRDASEGEFSTLRPAARPVRSVLLTPARIGPVEIKNRIVMPPMTTRTADDEGFVTEAFFRRGHLHRDQPGATADAREIISDAGRAVRQVGIYDDRFIPGLRRLTDAIH